MATTYELIASTTVGSGGTSPVVFSSIPSTYTDLLLKVSARSNRASTFDDVYVKPNNSSAGSVKVLYGDGASALSYSSNAQFSAISEAGNSATSNVFGNADIYIPNYLSTTNKLISTDGISENNGTTSYMAMTAGLSTVTSAITYIHITPGDGTLFLQYSTFYLYGIKNS